MSTGLEHGILGVSDFFKTLHFVLEEHENYAMKLNADSP